MAIVHTPEQKKRLAVPWGPDPFPDGDASQATIEVLGMQIAEATSERIYTVLIRDPLNLKEPIGADIHVFTDGTMSILLTVQAEGVSVEDIEAEFDIEVSSS
jgi:hypothetical protein